MADLESLREELQTLVRERAELADHGRYYLFDPEIATDYGSLTHQIERVRAAIAAIEGSR